MPDDQKFASVDTQRIAENSLVFQDLKRQAHDQYKNWSDRFDSRARDLEKLEHELEKKAKLVSAQVLQAGLNDLNFKRQKLQDDRNLERQRMEETYREGVSVMNDRVRAVTAVFAKENGYVAVFEVSSLVASELDDITDDLISELNEQVSTYKLDWGVTRVG